MNSSTRVSNHVSRAAQTALLALGLSMGFAAGCHAAPAMQSRGSGPDLTIGGSEFPDDDAVILRWEQHWTLDPDGTVHRRDRRWVKLLNDRAIGRYADPRIDFNNANEKVVIHAAQTHLSDGTILPVPEYSFNIAAPGDVAGWPQYADWQQRIVSFSGIEDDCVLELDYEVVTEPGVKPWISADLRLNEDDPTVERVVTLTVPASTDVLFRTDNIDESARHRQESVAAGTKHTWMFGILAGAPGEPQSPPWQQRCGRLRFTTAPSGEMCCGWLLTMIDHAGRPDDRIATFAKDAIEGKANPAEQIEALVGKMRATFNYVDSLKTLQSFECRPAAEVFRANYGNQLEAGALLAAACRALDLEVRLALAVDGRLWSSDVPIVSELAGVVAIVETDEGPVYVHPQAGVFTNPGTWGDHLLLSTDRAGKLEETYIASRGEEDGSVVDIAGRIVLAADGSAEGELDLALTGAFFDPAGIKTSAAQADLARRFVNRLVSGFNVVDCSLTGLSEGKFRAKVQVRTAEVLQALGDGRLLTLGDGPVSLGSFPMPLDRSGRRTEVLTAGAFVEHVDLAIALPDGFEAKVIPDGLAEVSGPWGRIVQTVSGDGSEIHLLRQVEVNRDRIEPAYFTPIRDALNFLRAEGSRRFLLGR